MIVTLSEVNGLGEVGVKYVPSLLSLPQGERRVRFVSLFLAMTLLI
jgi:hypothetical protein